MQTSAPAICAACAHHAPQQGWTGQAVTPDTLECRHPAAQIDTDVITGKATYWLCDYVRSTSGRCGADGRLFRQAERGSDTASTPLRKPNLTRADRIHALFMRNARRFKDVAFAARLAFDRLEQLKPCHPDYRALSAVASHAQASMATLNARSIRLAHAEIATLTHREEACHVK